MQSGTGGPQPDPTTGARVAESRTIHSGALTLDLDGYSVRVHDQDVPVTFTEFLLLKELATTPYRTFDRGALAEVAVARGTGPNAEPMTYRAIDLHISRLRKKLAVAGCDCIRTMRFVGYRFVPC